MNAYPAYKELHGALKEELSPSRRRAREPEGGTADDVSTSKPTNGARDALGALLEERNQLAVKLRALSTKPVERTPRNDFDAPMASLASTSASLTLQTMLEPIAQVLGLTAADLESMVSDDLPEHPSTNTLSALSDMSTNDEKAKYVVGQLLEDRPWLSGGLNETQGAAAAHLLLYAEGLQCYKQKYQNTPKRGVEVEHVEMGMGVVEEVGGGVARVRFKLRTETVPLAEVRVRHRRVVPVEAVERWGDVGLRYPSKAAHSRVVREGGKGKEPQDIEKMLRPLMRFLGDETTDSECFTQHDLSFHLREGSRDESFGGDDPPAYQATVGVVGRHVQLIDDPHVLKQLCSTSYDANVDASLVIPKAGCCARVAQVNAEASTARLIFPQKNTALWVPLRALSLYNTDPMLAMGCRSTSISVLGNPTQHEIAQAAKAISAREAARRLERRKVS